MKSDMAHDLGAKFNSDIKCLYCKFERIDQQVYELSHSSYETEVDLMKTVVRNDLATVIKEYVAEAVAPQHQLVTEAVLAARLAETASAVETEMESTILQVVNHSQQTLAQTLTQTFTEPFQTLVRSHNSLSDRLAEESGQIEALTARVDFLESGLGPDVDQFQLLQKSLAEPAKKPDNRCKTKKK
mmetsp:Transcript_94071/g.292654  ORF Transcript_94071/g.292654 Transcript_94071/m.292654 type:complete len:186 (+) Transcript_94071:1-558(+)